MFGDDIVVRTRLVPPRLPRRTLRRARLDQLIANAAEYPVTIVHSSAGYGKTSALAAFAVSGGWPTIWDSLAPEDADPLVFLVQLISACRVVLPSAGRSALARLARNGHAREGWNQALDALLNDLFSELDDDTLLVLDDYHVVDHVPAIRDLVTRLIAQRPSQLHLVLGSRHWPQLPVLPILQARQELCAIGEAELRWTTDEIVALFRDAPTAVTVEQAQALADMTDGWIIALQLLWQSAMSTGVPLGQRRADPGQDVEAGRPLLPPPVRDLLFTYLAEDVLSRQPADVQSFLLSSSVLVELDRSACNAVLGIEDADELLQMLNRRGLFLTPIDAERYRYHPLFHAFLARSAATAGVDLAALHRRAVAFYRTSGAGDNVLHHLMALGDLSAVGVELAQWVERWLQTGRFTTLLDWLARLPSPVLQEHPSLLLAQGDAARQLARFDLALDSYRAAEAGGEQRGAVEEQVRGLEGQARIYLDTVEPALADRLLRRAYRLVSRADIARRAELVRLIAENRLNLGRADQAWRLTGLAARIDSHAGADALLPRMYLRLGRLAEARRQLVEQHAAEAPPAAAHLAEAHRERSVLLALVAALEGDGHEAQVQALHALDVAQDEGATLLEAVAHIRLGHAFQLLPAPDLAAANRQYVQAMALADGFGVQRTKAEAYLGLVLLHGFAGEVAAAAAAASAGLELARRGGDAWTGALLHMALGAVTSAGGVSSGRDALEQALAYFRRCHDTYGQTVAHLWLAVGYQHRGQRTEVAAEAVQALALTDKHGYEGIWATPTLFGPRDRLMLVPLLLAARAEQGMAGSAQALLVRHFPAIAADAGIERYHPGRLLHIQTLGRLHLIRGMEELSPAVWQRKKSSQLLALLLTERDHWLQREQIYDRLWPDANAEEAEAQFKVTLNALHAVLEPARPPRTPPCYVRREGTAYRFVTSDGVWLDVDAFEAHLETGLRLLATGKVADHGAAAAELQAAVSLYGGAYLSEYRYDEWLQTERERLAMCFLRGATALAGLWLEAERLDDAAQLCELLLVEDPGWEDAYQLLMRIYDRQGNRRLALAIYDRCVRNLRSLLDVAPLKATQQIYAQIKA